MCRKPDKSVKKNEVEILCDSVELDLLSLHRYPLDTPSTLCLSTEDGSKSERTRVVSTAVRTNDRPTLVKKCYSLPPTMHKKIEARAKDLGVGEAELVRRVLDEYFERHPPLQHPGRTTSEPTRRTR